MPKKPPMSGTEFARSILEDPEVIKAEIERAKKGDRRTLKTLLAYARDPRPTAGRARARKILIAAGISWEDPA
jgi:hypothetical protein